MSAPERLARPDRNLGSIGRPPDTSVWPVPCDQGFSARAWRAGKIIASCSISPPIWRAAASNLDPALTAARAGWIAEPLPAVMTAPCVMPLLIYSIDWQKYRMISSALSERRTAAVARDPHR
jgi:hypothetical protein